MSIFERERWGESTGEGREREREGNRRSEAGSVLTADSPTWDLNSHTMGS